MRRPMKRPTCGTKSGKSLATSGGDLPDGVDGPYFNDEFGDTYGTICALTGDGFTHAELKDW